MHLSKSHWSPLLRDEQLLRLAEAMTVRLIMTERADFVSIGEEQTVGEARCRMGGIYDYLPVFTGDAVVGLINRHDIRSAGGSESVRSFVRSADLVTQVASASLRATINRLIDDEALLIAEDDGSCSGLVHYADLNRQAARLFLYLWLSALEMGLAEVLRRSRLSLEDWLRHLSEHKKVDLLGRFELNRRQNIDLDPIELVQLSDLLNVFRHVEGCVKGLGLTNAKFERKTSHLVELRHAAMHPVRAVVRAHGDVARLAERLADVEEVVGATHRVLRGVAEAQVS